MTTSYIIILGLVAVASIANVCAHKSLAKGLLWTCVICMLGSTCLYAIDTYENTNTIIEQNAEYHQEQMQALNNIYERAGLVLEQQADEDNR